MFVVRLRLTQTISQIEIDQVINEHEVREKAKCK